MKTYKSRCLRLLRLCTSINALGILLSFTVPFILVAQLMVGCTAISGLVTRLTPNDGLPSLQTITLSSDSLSNNGAPVAVDLVQILDKKPLEVLGTLRANEWFINRQDLMRQYPNQIRVISWEVVPGQVIKLTNIPETQGSLLGVLIFANYPGEESFRADASRMPNTRVNLHKVGFSISAL